MFSSGRRLRFQAEGRAMGRDSSGSIVTGNELENQGIELRTRLDRSWGPYPGVQGPGRGVDHTPPPSAEVKERVKL